ncbi:hypothetical protein XO10_07090 [Marinitoga sp. 1135]|nr:hypothetical protein [Marinitoga sp. 1135]NUU97950.1 hypothetical protein [Marinitoga sp. 1138]
MPEKIVSGRGQNHTDVILSEDEHGRESATTPENEQFSKISTQVVQMNFYFSQSTSKGRTQM